MSKSNKWKSKLISSSLPLEFEVAKYLVSKGFSVTPDYTYARNDLGTVKDFSVDLRATAYLPFSNPNKIKTSLDLLVECKQRNPSVKWLFFPDPNLPDFSPITLGCTIRAVDEFSINFFRPNATVDFDRSVSFCYKGVEVNESNGDVYEPKLKHGISQLQYALPRLLRENALSNLHEHFGDSYPYLFCPILLTTAELMLAERTLTTTIVEKAECLSNISETVPYLVLYCDYSPDFERHCIRECVRLKELDSELLDKFDRLRYENGEYSPISTSFLCHCLAEGMGANLHWYFTQFVVCNIKSLDTLIKDIKKISSIASRTLKKTKSRNNY